MENVEQMMRSSDEELLAQLGRTLWTQRSHAMPPNPRALQVEARAWFQHNLPRIKDAICGSSIVNSIREKSDEIALVGAIADIFSHILGFPSPSTVAILVVRIGLNKLCLDGGVAGTVVDAKP